MLPQLPLQFVDVFLQVGFVILLQPILFQQFVLVFHQLRIGVDDFLCAGIQQHYRDDKGDHEHDDNGNNE